MDISALTNVSADDIKIAKRRKHRPEQTRSRMRLALRWEW